MFVVLSRASRAVNQGYASAEHEAMLTNLFCNEASRRVTQNLKDALDPQFIDNTKLMSKIAKDLGQHGHVVAQHPLGF